MKEGRSRTWRTEGGRKESRAEGRGSKDVAKAEAVMNSGGETPWMRSSLNSIDLNLLLGAVPIEIRGIKLGSARQVLRTIRYSNDASGLRNERLVSRKSDCW